MKNKDKTCKCNKKCLMTGRIGKIAGLILSIVLIALTGFGGVVSAQEKAAGGLPNKGDYYYDLKNVVLYLDTYGSLPDNYITKKEARKLGWSGGSLEDYFEGGAIGGDYYGNYEKTLPSTKGIKYTECDIGTLGKKSRGAKRLIFSNKGKYYYTSDHYETFTEVVVKNQKVYYVKEGRKK